MDENLLKKENVLDENEGKKEEELTSAPEETTTEIPELNSTPNPESDFIDPPVDNVKNDMTLGTTAPEPTPEKTFTQSEVNELMGHVRAETRDRTLKYVYGRYGVEDENGLDDLMGNAQRYDTLKEESDNNAKAWQEKEANFNNEFAELKEKIALMESGIDKERYEDAKFILKGKGQPVTVESITAELATHPEWKKSEDKKVYTPEEVKPQPQIEVPNVPNILGNENMGGKPQSQNEEDLAMGKYFKIK